jgi:SMODS-associated and fused to various effectors sensor domain
LVGRSPTTGFLRQRDDLESFRVAYRGLLARLRGEHTGLRELHVFPAVPAPVAVACGFDLLPKVDPTLVIYDNLMKDGGFIERLRVNT